MNIKKILAAASAAALVSTWGMAAVATAASVSISADRGNAMPGETITITATGECADADGSLTLLVDGAAEAASTFYSGTTISYTVPEANAGLVLGLVAECRSGDGELLGTSNELSLNVFGASWVVSDPELFTMGEPVTISGGDFTPGAQVTVSLSDDAGTERFSGVLGAAGDDFSVSGQVTFPAELEAGEYTLYLTDGTNSASVSLTVHPDEPEPTQTPVPDPTATPTPEPGEPAPTGEPTPTASPTSPPPAQPGPGGAPAPTRGGTSAPGLPATGD